MSKIIIYIIGVSGAGKTTLAKKLSERTTLPWFDGDDFHPPENVQKMENGQPLNDEDRHGWLESINHHAWGQPDGAIYACSALKERYRKVLSSGLQRVQWVYLKGSFELIEERMKQRADHFMPAGLLQSQFDTLEEPVYGLHLDVSKKPEELIERICSELNL